jgi:hypothetical protein
LLCAVDSNIDSATYGTLTCTCPRSMVTPFSIARTEPSSARS